MTSPSTRSKAQPIKEETRSIDRSMRARQLVSTVRQGRQITVSILDEGEVSGYLCGWDDDTYFLIVPVETPPNAKAKDPVKMLVPKRNILYIELHDERSFFEHPDYDKMVNVVKPFKDLINNQYFSN